MKGNYFDQIAGAVKLDSRVSVYVPSTTDTDKPTDNREQVEKVAAKLSAMFGGATATEARGYWCSQSAGLVGEGVTIVYSAATPSTSRHTPPKSSSFAGRSKRTCSKRA
jgi:hypothetical protein